MTRSALINSSRYQAACDWLKANVAPSAQLTCDSRTIANGDVFMAYAGARADARHFIPKVIAQKAGAVMWDLAPEPFVWSQDWQVPNYAQSGLKQACGHIAADWYGHPSHQLWSVGITGTSGKSSCALWIAQAFSNLGKRCAVVGTLGIGFVDKLTDTGLTTPDPVWLQRSLRQLVNDGAQALAMEVSSIGLQEGRTNGMKFDVALFTNLSRDHLDYHGDMPTYEAAKAQLFAWDGLRHAVINLDDAAGPRMAAIARANGVEVLGFGTQAQEALLRASDLTYSADGMRFNLHGPFGSRAFATTLIGHYNVSNLLGVLGVLLVSGVSIDDALKALQQLKPAAGRLERVAATSDKTVPLVLVDYAHKPDALEKALAACRPLAQARNGKLIVVFGCGGDRDTGKRPLMGAIAERLADQVVLTSDNPRSETPSAIIDAIVAGIHQPQQVAIEVDRRLAIHNTLREADVHDVILIAGKGHESYQEIAGVKYPFADVAVAQAALAERTAS